MSIPVLDPISQWFLKFLQQSGGRDISQIPVAEARAMDVKMQAMFSDPKPGVHRSDLVAPVGPKGAVRLQVTRPSGGAPVLPAVMFFHGGGWVLGDRDTYERMTREIAVGAQAAVIFVEYSRSPEERYPVALEECYAATRWVAEHGSEIGVFSSRIAVVGDSAGGNLAAAVALLAKQRNAPEISGQVLIYPKTSAGFNSPSFTEFATGYFVTSQTSRWFWRQYAPDPEADREPTACPLEASPDQLKDLPPALVIIAECDVLRDEGEDYARKLAAVGAPVTCTRYLGTMHGFLSINALAGSPAARSAMAQVNAALREMLVEEKPGVDAIPTPAAMAR